MPSNEGVAGLPPVVDVPVEAPRGTLVLLHGHAGSPESLLEPAVQLAAACSLSVRLPRGPVAVEGEWAWWTGGRHRSPAEEARNRVARVLDELGGASDVVAGFSQGAAMALLAALTHSEAGREVPPLVLVAGFVPDGAGRPAPGRLPEGLAVLVLHGLDDDVVDPDHGARLARWCARSGAAVTEASYPGAHEWPPETTDAVVAWLRRLRSD